MTHIWDYIVLGAGSAGSVVAARLSEDPKIRVLLLEAGGRNRDLRVSMPAANAFVFGNRKFDWAYYTEPQEQLNGRRIYWPRGRGLGGSSAINGMVWIRGNQQDYDSWRDLGLKGWGYSDVLPYFRKCEQHATIAGPLRGSHGPMKVGRVTKVVPIDEAFIAACAEAGLSLNEDFNGDSQEGAGYFDLTVHCGRRSTVHECYFGQRRSRPNVSILTGAHVTGLQFSGLKVTGVNYRRGEKDHTAMAGRDVIVGLGSIGTPQLLMLSGLGPASELRGHGIAVRIDLPGVGHNLQDHLDIPLQFACTDARATWDRWQKPHLAVWLAATYFLSGGRYGPGANTFWAVGAFVPDPERSGIPTHQIIFTPMVVSEDPNSHKKLATSGFQLDIIQMHPHSRGWLGLKSADPFAAPVIQPNYLSDERDRLELIDAVHIGRRIVAQPALGKLRGEEISPGVAVKTNDEILAAVQESAISNYHPVGTCKMGADGDEMAVLDARMQVRGVAGLRVVDASAAPVIPTGNTNAAVVMMAEKAADMIKEDQVR